ncbi:hypothetical protein L596_012135 [Steinernema carpocapsae]|uniref:Uncharacterized protein n=1 Tax=Steinernema carpocapsae TaxID=34508 RepID=A0A4U5NW72_STECR|nr:hypothetical protein L596_012135 [Steinernema carpocapsae]
METKGDKTCRFRSCQSTCFASFLLNGLIGVEALKLEGATVTNWLCGRRRIDSIKSWTANWNRQLGLFPDKAANGKSEISFETRGSSGDRSSRSEQEQKQKRFLASDHDQTLYKALKRIPFAPLDPDFAPKTCPERFLTQTDAPIALNPRSDRLMSFHISASNSCAAFCVSISIAANPIFNQFLYPIMKFL